MKKKKRLTSILLALTLLLALVPGAALAGADSVLDVTDDQSVEDVTGADGVQSVEESLGAVTPQDSSSGTVGGASYTIDENGVLTVGSGSFSKTQWWAIFIKTGSNGTPTGPKDIAKTITKVVFEDGATITDSAAGMFYGWLALQEADLSKLNTSNVTDMWSMFSNCSVLTKVDLSGLDTAKTAYMDYMFYSCKALTFLNLSAFNTKNVTTMNSMFYNCQALETIIFGDNFDTSKVTDMYGMFYCCYKLKSLDLSRFSTSNVTAMNQMFYYCEELTTIAVGNGWNTDKVTNSSQMFAACNKLTGGAGTTYSNTYTDKTYARVDGGTDAPGYLTWKQKVEHTHAFTYAAVGDTITATCTAEGCNLIGSKVTLTLKAPAINTYGLGQNANAILEGTEAFNAATGKEIAESSINYYKGETKLGAAPTDAGDYTARITVEDQTATVSYTIQKGNNTTAVGKPQAESKTETSITLKATEGYEYKCGDGEWQTSNVFTGLTAGTSYTFYQRIAETANYEASAASAGTEISTEAHIHVHDFVYSLSDDGKTITATCQKTDPGHTGADSAALTINTPKLLVVPETRDVGSTGLSIISPNYAATLTGREDFKEFTSLDIRPIQIKYYSVNSETETALDNYPHEAGTYRAKITAGEKTASVEYTISKIDLTADNFTYAAPENLVYNGEEKTATVTSKKEGVGEVTVEYWDAQGQKLDCTPVNAGTYTVKISVTESTRYNSAEHLTADEWTFTINSKDMTVSASDYNGNYDELAHGITLTVTEPASGYTVKYGTEEGIYNLESSPTQTKTGTLIVYYQVTADNYTTYTGSATVTINKATATAAAPTAKPLAYIGSAQALVNAGSTDDGTMQYALGTASEATEAYSTSVPTATDAGTYYVWYKVVGDENHNDSDAACVVATITAYKATVTVSGGDPVGYDALEAAFVAANAAGINNPDKTVTVTLFADITVIAPISVEADIILDLNGHTVTRAGA